MTRWPATPDYPQIWFLGFILLIWLIGRLGLPAPDIMVPLGWLLVLAGLALMIWAARDFRRHRTTINPHGQPERLLTTGPFAVSRNPIYLADSFVLAGLALAWQALPGLLLIPLFVWIITQRFILQEEARLRAGFPDSYPAYTARVRRWL